MSTPRPPILDLASLDAVVFDTDGVVTDTARVHAAAWKRTFDSFLRRWVDQHGGEMRPFEIRGDYLRYVDGMSRLDGVRGFLAARAISLPEGGPSDPPHVDSVYALGQRKDACFLEQVRRYGVAPLRSAVALIRELRRRGVRTAAVSASRNCGELLSASGTSDMFDVVVDGVEAARLALPGKPHPALFLEATRRLETPPSRAAVVEDAFAGVTAGRRGEFGLVVGVDHGGQAAALCGAGADIVVCDLEELRITGRSGIGPVVRAERSDTQAPGRGTRDGPLTAALRRPRSGS